MIKKPFNPYIFRHSALTAKSKFLKENNLRQHAGWSGKSHMHLKYVHYFGNESNESLLAEYGIITEANNGNVLLPDNLRPKQCPNCSESNIPDSKFCSKCRMVLTYDAYNETIEEQKSKDKRLEELEQNFKARLQTQQKQQELLEALWLHQQQPLPNKEKEEFSSSSRPPIKAEKFTLSRRNETGIPSTPWMETFMLVDNRKTDEENSKNFTNMLFDKDIRLPWRRVPNVTKEQEKKWHRALVEGLKEEQKQEEGKKISSHLPKK